MIPFLRTILWDLVVAAAALLGLSVGVMLGSWPIGSLCAAVGVAFIAVRWQRRSVAAAVHRATAPVEARDEPAKRKPTGDDAHDLVERMIEDGRYALLLRQQLIDNLTDDQLERALLALDDDTALTPEGAVALRGWCAVADPSEGAVDQRIERVEAIFLDRYPVTNRRFKEFVDDGGYEQISLWEEEALLGLLDFVDRSGQPGPAFWEGGAPPRGKEDHPVVGVAWHEACAYARWAGKRLPTDSEWVKTAAWPVGDRARPLQRKFPWGDAVDATRANLWATGLGDTAPVDEFEGGVSVGGVHQLVGNVWEWTDDDFATWGDAAATMELDRPMKTLRGGAFDTYFDRQAACDFHSADALMARKHNIGFRCCLALSDLAEMEREPVSSDEARIEVDDRAAKRNDGAEREYEPELGKEPLEEATV